MNDSVSELPIRWSSAHLEHLAQLVNGDRGKNYPSRNAFVDSGIPFINAGHLCSGRINFEEMNYISADHYALLGSGKVRPGDILYCLRGSLGKVAVVNGIDAGAIASSLVIMRPASVVSVPYLYYFLVSPLGKAQISEYDNGSAQPNLAAGSVGKFKIPVAPLNEQKRIADKLASVLARVEACRDRLDRIPALLKRFRQSIRAAATSGRLTEDWRNSQLINDWSTVTLGQVAAGFSYGSAAKSAKNGSIPVLRMGNIQDGRLDWSDLVFTSDPGEVAKYRLEKGDVLFNRTNSPELVGKTAVFNGEREAIYAGYLIRVRCSARLLPDYLNYCLGSPDGRDYCWRVKSDGVSQSNINAQKLAAFKFQLPPLAEQHEIVRRVEILFAFADRLEARYTAARQQVEQLTPALLAKAFRGELVPQDPSDEPAAELLKRLAAVRAAAPPPKRGRKVAPSAAR